MDVDEALDELYARPLDEFVAARNDLAKQLAAAGAKDAATDLRKRKKPVVAAWAMNQLARRERDELNEMFDVVGAMADSSDAGELRKLSERRSGLVQTLAERAETIVEEAGHGSGHVEQQISMTLLGATDEEVQQVLLAGHLTQLPDTAGGQWSLASLPETDPEEGDDRADAAERAERAAVEAERELRERERALEDARAGLDAAEKAVEQARRSAEEARDAAEELKANL